MSCTRYSWLCFPADWSILHQLAAGSQPSLDLCCTNLTCSTAYIYSVSCSNAEDALVPYSNSTRRHPAVAGRDTKEDAYRVSYNDMYVTGKCNHRVAAFLCRARCTLCLISRWRGHWAQVRHVVLMEYLKASKTCVEDQPSNTAGCMEACRALVRRQGLLSYLVLSSRLSQPAVTVPARTEAIYISYHGWFALDLRCVCHLVEKTHTQTTQQP